MPHICMHIPQIFLATLDAFKTLKKTHSGLVHGPWALYGSYCRHAGPILREFSTNGREFQHRSFMVLPHLLARIVVPPRQKSSLWLAGWIDHVYWLYVQQMGISIWTWASPVGRMRLGHFSWIITLKSMYRHQTTSNYPTPPVFIANLSFSLLHHNKADGLLRHSNDLHPGKLTWNPDMEVWKMIFLSNWVIFDVPYEFPGVCMQGLISWGLNSILLLRLGLQLVSLQLRDTHPHWCINTQVTGACKEICAKLFLYVCVIQLQYICTYIYIYIRVIIPVRRWAKCHACQPKWVFAIFQNVEKLFSHFSLTSSSCQDQMRLLVPHKSCRCYSHVCTTAKHSALTLCQAFCAMLQQREHEFFCIWTSSVL